ncbi:MAG: TIGR02597 family protein [Opitutaceae bacterium]
MKKYIKPTFILAGALLAASSNLQAVETEPVGYVTVTVAGTGGVAAEAFTYMGVPLHKSSIAAGAITGIAANTITASGAAWTVDDYAGAYVLITSGTNEGVSSTISSNTATELTTVDDLTSLLAGDETFTIREYTTIADVFGAANEAGLDGGTNSGEADTVLFQSPSGFTSYYYKDGGFIGGTGWRTSTDASTEQGGTTIPFGDGIIVVRKQSADLDIVLSGSVFGGDATTPVEAGFNWKSASIPVDLTLAGLFGAANEVGLDGGSNSGEADNIIVPAGGGLTTYYYKDSGFIGGTGWRTSTDASTEQGATVIVEPGQMFLINRSGGAAFNLTEASPL